MISNTQHAADDAVDLSAIAAEEAVATIDSCIEHLLHLSAERRNTYALAKSLSLTRQMAEYRAYIRGLVRSLAGLPVGSADEIIDDDAPLI